MKPNGIWNSRKKFVDSCVWARYMEKCENKELVYKIDLNILTDCYLEARLPRNLINDIVSQLGIVLIHLEYR